MKKRNKNLSKIQKETNKTFDEYIDRLNRSKKPKHSKFSLFMDSLCYVWEAVIYLLLALSQLFFLVIWSAVLFELLPTLNVCEFLLWVLGFFSLLLGFMLFIAQMAKHEKEYSLSRKIKDLENKSVSL